MSVSRGIRYICGAGWLLSMCPSLCPCVSSCSRVGTPGCIWVWPSGGGQRLCRPHVPARALPGTPVPGRGTSTNVRACVRACAELLKAEAGGGAWDPTFKPTERRGRLRLRRVRGGSESLPPEAFSCGGKRPPMRAGPVTWA